MQNIAELYKKATKLFQTPSEIGFTFHFWHMSFTHSFIYFAISK